MNEPIIYRGDNFRKFLIDRYAMGFDYDMIAKEFEELHGITISTKDVGTILEKADGEIKAREQEINEIYSSTNLFAQLDGIRRELNKVRERALDRDDLRSYAQLTNSSLKAVELLLKAVDGFRKREEQKVLLVQQNNYYAIELLEKDGIIKIVDTSKLKRLMGADEHGEKKE